MAEAGGAAAEKQGRGQAQRSTGKGGLSWKVWEGEQGACSAYGVSKEIAGCVWWVGCAALNWEVCVRTPPGRQQGGSRDV